MLLLGRRRNIPHPEGRLPRHQGLSWRSPGARIGMGVPGWSALINGEVQVTRGRRRYRATYFMKGGLVAIMGRGASISMAAGGLPPQTAAKLTLGRWVEEGSVQAEQDDAESGPNKQR